MRHIVSRFVSAIVMMAVVIGGFSASGLSIGSSARAAAGRGGVSDVLASKAPGVNASDILASTGSSRTSSAVKYNDRGGTYEFPYESPYLASVTARLLSARRLQASYFTLAPLYGREEIPLLEGRADIEITVVAQPKPAPVVFVIPGYGGSNRDGQSEFIAERLFDLGHSVIVVPSPSFWRFVIGQNTVPLPGYVPEEAKDLQRVMKIALAQARTRYRLQPTAFGLVGYSLGAQHAGFLAMMDKQRPEFDFKRVLMINPPLDVAYAIGNMDRLYDVGKTWSRQQKDLLWGIVLSKGQELLDRVRRGENVIDRIDQYIRVTEPQLQFLIADTFRSSLTEMIFVSQQVEDIGLLKTPAWSGRREPRMAEARAISFQQFLQTALWPQWSARLKRTWTLPEFVATGNLSAVIPKLGTMENIYFMHNRNDFVVNSVDLERLATALGPRAYIYRRGGHLGNLWHPQNVRDLQEVFSGLR